MTLQRLPMPLYALLAGAKSSARPAWNPADTTKAHQRPHTFAGAFFMPVMRSYGGTFWASLLVSFVAESVSVPPRIVSPPNARGTVEGGSKHKGATPMAQLRLSNLITRNLSSRAAAHRAMAKAALFADSSTRTRLNRYNHHIAKAQQLEARLSDTAKRSAGGMA
ncbi:MAG: hypothetical protein Q8S08_10040 [Halomonas sp.]|nr:hypothetical protein [Halomonas sp.]MDP3535716.1 hypothetical protein [Halomonas sp.]